MRRLPLAMAGLLMAVALAACGSAAADQPSAPASADPGALVVVARSMAFQPSELQATAGTPFRLVFQNQDSVPHNVAIYRTADFKDPVSVGQIVTAASATQSVPALPAGTYAFRCDVHPDMKGTLVVR